MTEFFEGKFQIGKNGINQGVIDSINLALKTHHQLRISVLKAATRNREQLKEFAEEIVKKIDSDSKYKIIGYTIILKKQSNKKRV